MGNRMRLQLRFRTDAEALLRHNPSWTKKARVKTQPKTQVNWKHAADLTLLPLRIVVNAKCWITSHFSLTKTPRETGFFLLCTAIKVRPLTSTTVILAWVHFSSTRSISCSAPPCCSGIQSPTEPLYILHFHTATVVNPVFVDKIPRTSNEALCLCFLYIFKVCFFSLQLTFSL